MRPHLIEARKKRGLTQAALGKMIGLSKQTISVLELGRIEGKPKTWDALERVLKVPQKKLRCQPETEEGSKP